MNLKITQLEKKMLIEAAKCLRGADEGAMGCATSYCEEITKETLKTWDALLKKLRRAGKK